MDHHAVAKAATLDMTRRLEERGYIKPTGLFSGHPNDPRMTVGDVLKAADDIIIALRNDKLALEHEILVLKAEMEKLTATYAEAVSRLELMAVPQEIFGGTLDPSSFAQQQVYECGTQRDPHWLMLNGSASWGDRAHADALSDRLGRSVMTWPMNDGWPEVAEQLKEARDEMHDAMRHRPPANALVEPGAVIHWHSPPEGVEDPATLPEPAKADPFGDALKRSLQERGGW